jgi:hypothetical protein
MSYAFFKVNLRLDAQWMHRKDNPVELCSVIDVILIAGKCISIKRPDWQPT